MLARKPTTRSHPFQASTMVRDLVQESSAATMIWKKSPPSTFTAPIRAVM